MELWDDFLEAENRLDALEGKESMVLAEVRLVAASMKQYHTHHSNHISFLLRSRGTFRSPHSTT
jgi:hypothetical protein